MTPNIYYFKVTAGVAKRMGVFKTIKERSIKESGSSSDSVTDKEWDHSVEQIWKQQYRQRTKPKEAMQQMKEKNRSRKQLSVMIA